MVNLSQLIAKKRIIITMGPGGVGKTTLAAALGLQAASLGRKALVLTLDPALRLASAMGLEGIKAGKKNVLSQDDLRSSGIPARQSISVGMLDTNKSWTDAITRTVSDVHLRNRILEHPFFRRMSRDLAGAREYAAMEELYHLYLHGDYDLLILDTPPTVHGVDFLKAPDRVLDVLEHDAYRWLMRPALLAGKMGLRMLNFSGGYAIRTLSRFTGMDFLKDLAGFVDLFSGLLEGFRQRASVVKATLRSDVTSFVLVTAAQGGTMEEAASLYRKLKNQKMSPDAMIVNRFNLAPPGVLDSSACGDEFMSLAAEMNMPVTKARQTLDCLLSAYRIVDELGAHDRLALESLIKSLPSCCSPQTIPMMDEDIHDLAGLEKLRRALFEDTNENSKNAI